MPTTKAASRTPTQKKPTIIIDRKRLARYQAELARLRRARADETEGWDDLYEALDRILADELFVMDERRFRSARQFLHEEMPGIDERTARQYARVARCFDPTDEQAHGIIKLDALIEYLTAASGAPPGPAKINLDKQRITVGDGQWVKFAEASRETIRRATRLLKATSEQQPKKMSPLVKAVKKALTAAGAGTVGVSLTRGQLLLSIAPSQLNSVGRILAKLELPAG